MSKKQSKGASSLFGRLLLKLRAKDEAGLMAELEALDAEEEETEEERKKREEADRAKTGDALSAQVAALAKTVDGLAQIVAALAKTNDEDPCTDPDDKKTEDEDEEEETEEKKAERAKVGDALKAVMSKAEIIVPGFAMPTADAVKSAADVTAVQRRVLVAALKSEDSAKVVSPLLGGKTVDAMSDDAIATAFTAASVLMGQANNARGERRNVTTKDFGRRAPTAVEINQRNAEFWAKRV